MIRTDLDVACIVREYDAGDSIQDIAARYK